MQRLTRTRQLLTAGAALAVTAAILPALPASTAGAAVSDVTSATGDRARENTLDTRGRSLGPTQAQLDAVKALVAAAPNGARVSWDERFGTPRAITGTGGYLTAARAGSGADVARSWIDGNRGAFGLSAAQISSLAVSRDHALPGTGTRVVTFTQVFDGVEAVHGGRLTVAVTRDGRVLSYGGNPSRGTGLAGTWSTSPAQALSTVADRIAGASFTPTATGEQAGYTVFGKAGFASSSYVKKVGFPTADGARAAYQVLFVQKQDEAWDTVVDAVTGEVLYRDSLVDHESEGTVYENFPGAPGEGGAPVVKSSARRPSHPAAIRAVHPHRDRRRVTGTGPDPSRPLGRYSRRTVRRSRRRSGRGSRARPSPAPGRSGRPAPRAACRRARAGRRSSSTPASPRRPRRR